MANAQVRQFNRDLMVGIEDEITAIPKDFYMYTGKGFKH